MTLNVEQQVKVFQDRFSQVVDEVSKVIVGNGDVISNVLTCLLVRGHVLLEGIPGVGKTKLVQTLSDVTDLGFSRIQFTPDLMPGDIIGSNVVREADDGKKSFVFQHGPVFTNILLADEINRATPKTQSALLEAMQENSVSAGGSTHKLDQPFFVLATQNPIEMEGTYPLPEAQMDRFLFKLRLDFPEAADLLTIVERTTQQDELTVSQVLSKSEILEMRETARAVPVAQPVIQYAIAIVLATHPESGDGHDLAKQYVRFGSSPRGVQSLILGAKVNALLNDRFYVSVDDVKAVVLPALRHRVLINFEAEAEKVDSDQILEEIVSFVALPKT
ncbi:MAG: MoxR family ATPase [Burkholderiales bacterium]|jgi:MoxR-like ATPase|nr:MoxR family ATPase [Burkholderiales bacterium]